jgi:hypothetical protein
MSGWGREVAAGTRSMASGPFSGATRRHAPLLPPDQHSRITSGADPGCSFLTAGSLSDSLARCEGVDEYGVLYLGSDVFCAFMESIGRGVLRSRLVPEVQVQQRGFSKIRFTTSLRLMDLVSSGGPPGWARKVARRAEVDIRIRNAGPRHCGITQRSRKASTIIPGTIPVGPLALCTTAAPPHWKLLDLP